MFDFPASPTLGQPFTPVSGGPAYAWDGTAWRMTSGGISAGVFIGDAPPANPVPGQLWWESDSGNTFIYFSDGSSSQWVQFNASPVPGNVITNMVQSRKTSSGTYTKPAGLKFLEVTCIGAGGGSGAMSDSTSGTCKCSSGGGGGGACVKLYAATDLAASTAFTVGVGTTGAGGTTSFSGQSASGGAGGTALATQNTYVSGGSRGTATGGDLNVAGGIGEEGVNGRDGIQSRAYGGGGGGSMMTPPTPGRHGQSFLAGLDGLYPGGGARGALSCNAGGAAVAQSGGDGCIILKEYF